MVSKIIHSKRLKVHENGAIVPPETWREAAGFEAGEEIEAALLEGKNGIFVGLWNSKHQKGQSKNKIDL